MTRVELDPRVFGVAPVEADAHEGRVLWTMAGVMRYLGVRSETTLRAMPWVMALRRTISPRIHRWVPAEVMEEAAKQPKARLKSPLIDKPQSRVRNAVNAQRKARRLRKGWEHEAREQIRKFTPEIP